MFPTASSVSISILRSPFNVLKKPLHTFVVSQAGTSSSSGFLGRPPSRTPKSFLQFHVIFLPRAFVHHHKERHNLLRFLGVVRSNTRRPNRHYDIRYSKERGRKFIRPKLPDTEWSRKKENVSFEELRSMLKKEGLPPGSRQYNERPMMVSSSSKSGDMRVWVGENRY